MPNFCKVYDWKRVTSNRGKKTPGVDGILWQGAGAKWRAADSLRRQGRSCADAVAAAFNALSKPNSATWALEGDIKGCFDKISQEWMLKNIPMDQVILSKWLKSGYVEEFIKERCLELSPEKTVITYIKKGFTFLGQTFRKHGRKLHITPSNEEVLTLVQKEHKLLPAMSARLFRVMAI